MNSKTTAAPLASVLAALMLAAAAGSAAAQDRGPDQGGTGHDRADRPANPNWAEHAHGEGRGSQGQPAPRPMAPPRAQAAPVAAAPVAPQPPQARPAPVAGANFQPRHGDRNWPGRSGGGGGDVGPAGPGASPADRQDHEDWDELRQARNWGGRNGERFAFAPGDAPDGQPQDRRGDRGDHRGDRGGRPGAPPTVTNPDHDRWRGPAPNVTPGSRPGADQGGQERQFRGGDRFDRNRDGDRRDGGHGDWDRDHRPPLGYDRDHRRDHPEWQRGRYPSIYRVPHRYHVTPYRWPFGYGVRSWGFGEVLPPVFWGPSYEIYEWWAYDLPAPPPGFTWVRVGYDALLVDAYDGRIVQVFRGLFWW